MDIISLMNIINASKDPIIIGVIIVLGMFLNLKVFRAENKVSLELFKTDVIVKLKNEFMEMVESIKSVINQHDINFLQNKKETDGINTSLIALRETVSFQCEKIETKLNEQTKLIQEHEKEIGMYNNFNCFLKEIRETVNHSLEILDNKDKLIAKEYLYIVCSKICDIVNHINTQGLTTISKLDFDALVSNAVYDCKCKFEHIYGSDVATEYFKGTSSVYTYKKELFELIDDKKVNNIERRYRTLTIKLFETVCANFIRKMYLKERI